MADTKEIDGQTYIHISYLKGANDTSKRRGAWLNELRGLLEDIRNGNPDIEDMPAWKAACKSGAMGRDYQYPEQYT